MKRKAGERKVEDINERYRYQDRQWRLAVIEKHFKRIPD